MNCSCARGGEGPSGIIVRVRILIVSFAIVLVGRGIVASPKLAATDVSTSSADDLVAAAAHAEMRGDCSGSIALWRDVLRQYPDNQLAHWRLGDVKIEKKWIAIGEIQQRASADRRQAEYRVRRAAADDSPAAQLALARWCRKNNLLDESRLHWANVLTADPNNAEALRALDVRWYRGRLLTTAGMAAMKKEDHVRQREQLAASLDRWHSAFDRKSSTSRSDALEEIRSIDYAEAIPAIEGLTVHPESPTVRLPKNAELTTEQIELRHQVSLAFLAAISKINEQAATEALVRQAVWSSFSDIRDLAADELKKRPIYDYAPILLSGLALPIESTYSIVKSGDGSVHYAHSLYRPGATADYSEFYSDNARPTFTKNAFDGDNGPVMTPDRLKRLAKNSASKANQYSVRARVIEANVAVDNEVSADQNQRIIAALTRTTGQKIGDDPRGWWTFWKDHNEYYSPPKQPVYQQSYMKNESYCCSCFVKGTLVWTKTGRRPVESLEVGDLVLSQNVDTGELRYEPVIGRTVRPPSPILKVSLDGGGELMATKGHPFWVAGVGWRMTKELGEDAVICGLKNSSRIRSIAPASEAEAYNLIVAELNTYFVGDRGILVHDNSPRRPTKAVLPGFLKE
jgi:hypothetical protein